MSNHVEKQYYESGELWQPERYIGIQLERAKTVLSWLPDDVENILDAGCGNGVFANLQSNLKIIAFDRAWTPLHWVQSPKFLGDILSIPFPDNYFDAVVCLEVIEHLPSDLFQQALRELERVARRYILISVPYCENLADGQIVCPGCCCRFHRNFHMRSFQKDSFKNLFSQESKFVLTQLQGIVRTKRVFGQSFLLSMKHFFLGSKFGVSHYCPQCKYHIDSQSSKTNLTSESNHVQSLLKYSKRYLPQVKTYNWWLAKYKSCSWKGEGA